jgi:hypothetical protein
MHTIPRTARSNVDRRNDVMPGWNEFVAPLRVKSILWHDIWVECGRPHDGVVASIMRRTRASYHYAVRYVKNNRFDIIKDRFASAILYNKETSGGKRKKFVEANPSYRALLMACPSLTI